MRDILFRGKRIDNGEWIQGHYGGYTLMSGVTINAISVPYKNSIGGSLCYDVDSTTVGQYTGLTDKNSKKIFEGDIIKIVPDYDYSDDYSISKVYSYNGIFCVDYHGDDFDSTALGFLNDYLPDGDFEVIGNIYDNPELLEVKK